LLVAKMVEMGLIFVWKEKKILRRMSWRISRKVEPCKMNLDIPTMDIHDFYNMDLLKSMNSWMWNLVVEPQIWTLVHLG